MQSNFDGYNTGEVCRIKELSQQLQVSGHFSDMLQIFEITKIPENTIVQCTYMFLNKNFRNHSYWLLI